MNETILAGLFLVAAVIAGFALVRERRKLRLTQTEMRLLRTALRSSQGVCYRWTGQAGYRVDGDIQDSQFPARLEGFLEAFSEPDCEALTDRLDLLRRDGAGFRDRLRSVRDAAVFEVSGQRFSASKQDPMDLIWVHDITPEAAAESSLRAARKDASLFRSILDQLPFAVWWRSSRGDPRHGNRSFSSTEGISSAIEAAALWRSPPPVIDGDNRPDFFELDLEGGPIVGFALDRSDARRVESELARLSLSHQQVLETVGTAIAVWGPDTRLIFSNSAFERLWGLERAWLDTLPDLGELFDTLRAKRVLPEYGDFRQFRAEQLQLFSVADPKREDFLYLPDDRTIRLRVRGHPSGGLVFAYEDVTDSLALERSFNTLTEVQRETLDNLFEGIAVFGSDGRLRLWNPTFAAMWSLDNTELSNRPHISILVERWQRFFRAEDWDPARRTIIEQVTDRTGWTSRAERVDGTVLEGHGLPLPDGNILLTYLDISDRVGMQHALREKEEALETAQRLKSQFMANISYELRTPLNAIIGFSEILVNQYFGSLNSRQLDYCQSVLVSSQRLLTLVNDILDLAAIEAGQMELDRAPIDIHTLLASIFSNTRERAEKLGLVVTFECPTDIGWIVGDERRLRQVMFNLVTNSLKFTPANGEIRLLASRHTDEIVMVVEDTGIGIEIPKIEKVFEPFERAHATRAVGAGLGLPLVRSFVELHGGSVRIDSAPGTGTRVTCRFPLGVTAPPQTGG